MAYKTEEEVKELFQIDSFRNIKKDQIVSFVSSIPDMDREVAIQCIEQFPNFKEYAGTMMGLLDNLYREALTQTQKNHEMNIAGYALLINDLHQLLTRPDVSDAERRYFIDKYCDVMVHVDALVKRQNDDIWENFKKMGAAFLGTVGVAGAILGARFLNRK